MGSGFFSEKEEVKHDFLKQFHVLSYIVQRYFQMLCPLKTNILISMEFAYKSKKEKVKV